MFIAIADHARRPAVVHLRIRNVLFSSLEETVLIPDMGRRYLFWYR
jgi:hypothetical protein